MPVRKKRGAPARSSNPRLAARLPGGSASLGREVPMWRRSEVEQLTGLERHVIQNLCNRNTSKDGLGFWEPAVMKPGYSRFEEGDLLAFYLVARLVKVGFAPSEVGAVVMRMLEDDGVFAGALRGRAAALAERRKSIDDKMEALVRLEASASSRPEDRLYSVMGHELLASADESLERALRELRVSDEERGLVRSVLRGLIDEVWDAACGKGPGEKVVALSADVARLIDLGADPTGSEARAAAVRFAEGALSESEVGPFEEDAGAFALLVRALAIFLSDVGNGVPLELALGRGSFAYLGKSMSALAGIDARGEEETA